MGNKIKLNRGDELNGIYELSDSEEEYTQNEKSLVKKVRENRRKLSESDEEVLGFDDREESDGQKDEDFADDFDNIPDSKAWGKKRSAFYNTDFADEDYSTYTEKEEELALQEEQEAKTIQQRLAKQFTEDDFSLDVYSELRENEKSEILETKLQTDLSKLSQRQKIQLFEKDSPEFNGLVQDFQRHIKESESLLGPILNYFASKGIKSPIVNFIQTQNDLILTYCTNISFYLLLKAKRTPVKNHPVVKRLVRLRQLLLKLEEKYQNVVKPQLDRLLEAIQTGIDLKIQDDKITSKKRIAKTKKLQILNSENDNEMDQDDLTNENYHLDNSEGSENDEQEDRTEEERRGITYQIAKNKGLTPHRKKELRNPRVKHRMKYKKALIRRKGAVRTARKELNRYSGEMSGIKSTVKKGIKLKS